MNPVFIIIQNTGSSILRHLQFKSLMIEVWIKKGSVHSSLKFRQKRACLCGVVEMPLVDYSNSNSVTGTLSVMMQFLNISSPAFADERSFALIRSWPPV